MAVIVKRYRVRHNGVVYGPGQPGGTVIQGLSEEEEARLVAGSEGSIEKYVPLIPANEESPKGENTGESTGSKDLEPAEVKEPEMIVKGDPKEPETPVESAPEDMKIPELNPDELIKPGKDKGRK